MSRFTTFSSFSAFASPCLMAVTLAACGGETAALPGHFQPEISLPGALDPEVGAAKPEILPAVANAPVSGATARAANGIWHAPLPQDIAPGLAVAPVPSTGTFDATSAEAPAVEDTPAVEDQPAAPVTPFLADGDVHTYTSAAWGERCQGDATPSCILEGEFGALFGDEGLELGSEHTLRLTSVRAINDALPAASQADVLTEDLVNPGASRTNALIAEVVALSLNMALSDRQLAGSVPLCDLRLASGPFAGQSVEAVFQFAQAYAGGFKGTGPLDRLSPDEIAGTLREVNAAGLGGVSSGFLHL